MSHANTNNRNKLDDIYDAKQIWRDFPNNGSIHLSDFGKQV